MPDETTGRTRRNLLTGGAAIATAAVTGSTAGCLTLLPPVGQEVRYGRVDMPAPAEAEPVYRRWMPAEDELPDVENPEGVDDIHWISLTPGALGRDELGVEFRLGAALAKSSLDYFGYEFQHYDYIHGLGALGAVAEGDVDSGVVTETLLDSGYVRDGTYSGWELFDRDDIPRTVAVSDSAVVQSHGENRRTFVETLLDAGDGRIDRRHERDEPFDAFSSWVGSYPTLLEGFGGGITDFEPDESAMAYTFDEEAAYYIYFQQYAEGETPTRGELQQTIEKSMETAVQAWAVDIEIDDTQVAVEMRVGKDELSDDSVEDRTPYVTWGVDDTPERVTVRHEAGEPVPVDQLDVEPVDALLDRPEPGTFLEPDDELTVDVEELSTANRQISLIYSYAGTEHDSAALLHYTPDEFETDE